MAANGRGGARGNGKSEYICSEAGCHKVFSRSSRLIVHLRTHTGERPFVCDKEGCGKSYARAAHLTRHQQVSHLVQLAVEKFRCTEEGCTEEFVSQHNLKKHVKRKHDTTRYQCTEPGCLRSFTKHQQLKVHQSEHTGVNSFMCPHEGCGQRFKIPSRLKRHLKIHTGYTCKYEGCEASFAKWSLYRKHIAAQHASSTAHTCPHCHKEFSQKQWLKQHMKVHQEDREMYVCPREDCGRSYLDQRNLTAHIRSYHDRVKFACTHPGCERKFASEQKRVQHQKLHDPDRPMQKKKRKKKPAVEKLLGHCNQDTVDVDDEDEALSLESAEAEKSLIEEQIIEEGESFDGEICEGSVRLKEKLSLFAKETESSVQHVSSCNIDVEEHTCSNGQEVFIQALLSEENVKGCELHPVSVMTDCDFVEIVDNTTKSTSLDLVVDEGFSESTFVTD